MESKQKILVCGDVNGKFKVLFNRVETINKKSGPFEILLVAGNFFGQNNDELEAYKNGNKQIPVPTFILGPNTENDLKHYENVTDICPNLTYLGKRGLYTLSSGLKIAYLSGIESTADKSCEDWEFNKDDVKAVRNSCFANKSSMGDYRGIDILLTSQWPKQIYEKETNTSKLLSWLAAEIRPRYHFCGLNGVYYERLPYRNLGGNVTQLELATRFIAMAMVGNAQKDKYIYALNVAAVDKLRVIDLIQKTTNETPCPYDNMNLSIDQQTQQSSENASGQYFYDMNSYNQGNNHKKRKNFGNDGEQKKHRQNIDQEKCWFCLSSPSVEKHLVIAIGDNFYLALSKGPINETHLLILSVTHIQSTSLLTQDDWKELEKFKTALRNYFKDQNKVVTFFERNYKSSHLQINVIACDSDQEWQIKNTFDDKAEEYNLQLEQLPKLTEATELPDKGAYFYAELPDNSTLLTRQMRHFPLYFGREVFCAETLHNCEEKINWKECLLSKEEECLVVKKIRDQFKPFDFTME